jgi:hypothetical protein
MASRHELTDKLPEPMVSARFKVLVHTNPDVAAFLDRIISVAGEKSSGAARTLLHDTIKDNTVRTTVERLFNERDVESPKQDRLPVPPNIHEQTRVILDSGLAHLMMDRMGSDMPQSPPFDSEFWVETSNCELDGKDKTWVYARWSERYGDFPGYFRRTGFRAESGLSFGHSGHPPLDEVHLAIVSSLEGWTMPQSGTQL